MAAPRVVPLRAIYAFDCENCGTENIVRPIESEISPDELESMSGSDRFDAMQGEWVSIPDRVKCKSCGAEFGTIDAADHNPE